MGRPPRSPSSARRHLQQHGASTASWQKALMMPPARGCGTGTSRAPEGTPAVGRSPCSPSAPADILLARAAQRLVVNVRRASFMVRLERQRLLWREVLVAPALAAAGVLQEAIGFLPSVPTFRYCSHFSVLFPRRDLGGEARDLGGEANDPILPPCSCAPPQLLPPSTRPPACCVSLITPLQ